MCTVLFAIDQHPKYKLIVAANRDEFLARPTAPLDWWKDNPNILAGRDLQGGGTWMGIAKNGRFATLTNYREIPQTQDDAPTRGTLVYDFLEGEMTPATYLGTLQESGQIYNGFNLVFGVGSDWIHYSNRDKTSTVLAAGIHGVSNALLNTPWPKIAKGKNDLAAALQSDTIDPTQLLTILNDSTIHPDELLPDTGIGLEWERVLSSIKIVSPKYGTRVSTAILVDHENQVTYLERTYPDETDQSYEFEIS
jgi:uncharacterized protein with NRDE domain